MLRGVEKFFTTLDNKLEKDVKTHLKNVYTTLALALLAAAAGSYVHVFTDVLKGNIFVSLGSIALLLMLYSTPAYPEYESRRFVYLMAFAGATGLSTGPLLDMAMRINPGVIVTAFMATCMIFGSFTLAALYAPDRKFLYLGGILLSTLSTLFWLSLANIFLGSALLFEGMLYIGLVVMCGFVLYDTQMIIEKCRRGDKDYIWHSVDLFIDFVDIFRRLLIILAMKDQNRDNKKRRD